MTDNNQSNETNDSPSSPNVNEKQDTSSAPKKSSTLSEVLSGIVGAVAGAAAGEISLNPFSERNAESISSGNSSIRSSLNSNASGGDLGTVGESRFDGDNIEGKSTIEVLSKIHKVLSQTNSTVDRISKDVVILAKNQTQQDISSNLSSINSIARQNELKGSKSSPVFAANQYKAPEEETSILDDISNFITGGKTGITKRATKEAAKKATNSTAKNVKKKIAEETVGEATKEAAKKATNGTAKNVEKKIAEETVGEATKEAIKNGPSVAEKIVSKIKKKGIVESTKDALKDAFSGWGKEAEKGVAKKETAKKIEKEISEEAPSTTKKIKEKGILDKLKDAFTGPKAKKIAGGAAIGGAAASIPGDVSDEYIKTIGMSESGGDPNIGAGTSSAVGLFQFVGTTWDTEVKKMGKNYSRKDRTDPKKAEEVMRFFTEENRKDFTRRNKREPTDKELHMSHFLGSEGSATLSNTNPDDIAAKVLPGSAKSNKDIFYKGHKKATKTSPEVLGTPRTVQEVKDLMGKRYDQSLNLVKKGAVPQTIKNIGSDKKTEQIPPLSQNTEASNANDQPEITGKNGKKVKLTGDTSKNPYFGKESTPYSVPYAETEKETASPFIPAAYNPDSEPPTTFGGAQFTNNQKQEPAPTPNAADNSKYDYYTDSTGKKLKENMETGEETAADDESGKLDAPKFMIRESKLAGDKTVNWKVDLESGEETLATDDDLKQDKQQKELEKQYIEKQQSSSATTAKTDTGDGLRYDIVTPGENSKVTTNNTSSSKSPKGTFNQSETTTVTTTGGGSTLHVQEQSDEEKAKLAKEEAHEKELEKKYEGVYKTDSYKDQGKPTASPLSKKERDMLNEVDSLNTQRDKLKAERNAEPSYKDYGDDKESMEKDLHRLGENYAKQDELDEKRNAIIGTQEYHDAVMKQKGKAPQQTPQQQNSPTNNVPTPNGNEGKSQSGNDDPTIKLMEEGLMA
jgi:hypothetical protein